MQQKSYKKREYVQYLNSKPNIIKLSLLFDCLLIKVYPYLYLNKQILKLNAYLRYLFFVYMTEKLRSQKYTFYYIQYIISKS